MKTITDTEFEHVIPTKYFRGIVDEIKTTPMGHTLIVCSEANGIKILNGTIIITKRFENEMNFMIPKRRMGIISEVKKSVKYRGSYVFKLQEESKSKKWLVSEVFKHD